MVHLAMWLDHGTYLYITNLDLQFIRKYSTDCLCKPILSTIAPVGADENKSM